MRRATSLVLLGSAALLLAYVNAPAAPTPAPAWVSAADLEETTALAPLAQQVQQESERLRARMAAVPGKPVPQRDPFRFGERPAPEPAAGVAEPVSGAPVEEADVAPVIAWPALVAVLADRGDSVARTAVLAIGDSIEILKAGDAIGEFVVREITGASVDIEHVATSTTTRLTLR